jgi:hypothetical protein
MVMADQDPKGLRIEVFLEFNAVTVKNWAQLFHDVPKRPFLGLM